MAKTIVKRGKAASSRAKKSSVRAKPKPVVATELVRDLARRLISGRVTFAHGTTDAVAEAAFIISETLGCHPDHVAMTVRLTAPQVARIRALVGTRIKTRKPAAYLLHKIYMRGVPFYIDERAIVPRSYIGEILDAHFADDAGLQDPAAVTRVLDLCTGSGCLAILAARAFPNATIDAVELSADAIDVARHNVDAHRLGDRIKLFQGDLFEPLGTAKYDLIIANPPYVDAEGMANLPRECQHEPPLAFDGGADGIAVIRRIIDEAAKHLNPGGGLLCEVGRCKPALEQAYPRTPFLWLDTEESEGEVFWLGTDDLAAE
jgi:ribosomal protein L3 glutamine methyltransferase